MTPSDAVLHEFFLTFEYTCYLILASAINKFWDLDLWTSGYLWICLFILLFRSIIHDEEQFPEHISIKIQLYRTVTNFATTFVAVFFCWLVTMLAPSPTNTQSHELTIKYPITIRHIFSGVANILYWYFLLLIVFSVIRTTLNLIHLFMKIVHEIQLHLYDPE